MLERTWDHEKVVETIEHGVSFFVGLSACGKELETGCSSVLVLRPAQVDRTWDEDVMHDDVAEFGGEGEE